MDWIPIHRIHLSHICMSYNTIVSYDKTSKYSHDVYLDLFLFSTILVGLMLFKMLITLKVD